MIALNMQVLQDCGGYTVTDKPMIADNLDIKLANYLSPSISASLKLCLQFRMDCMFIASILKEEVRDHFEVEYQGYVISPKVCLLKTWSNPTLRSTSAENMEQSDPPKVCLLRTWSNRTLGKYIC